MQLSEYIETRKISPELSKELRSYPQTELCQLITSIEPSANALKTYLQLINEIARRDECSVSSVFQSEELQAVLSLEQVPRKERGKRYRQILEIRRYPELAKIRQTIEENTKALSADCNFKIQLPKDLEGDSLTVSFSVRSPEDFLKFAKRLQEAATHRASSQIFSMLRGDYE